MKLKKFTYIAMLLGGSAIFNVGCDQVTQNTTGAPVENIEDNITTISAVGDIMVHGSQIEAQFDDKNNTYSFDNNFKNIKNIIDDSDLAIANLETTVNVSRPPSGYPSFNAPKELLASLKSAGFDIISTINNHSLDTGYTGVLSTLNELKVNELESVGTKESIDKKNYIMKDVDGIKIGISTFSYGGVTKNNKFLNGISAGKATNLLNVIDESSVENAYQTIKTEIDNMKSEGAEFLIVGIHWGIEYQKEPNEYQKQLAQKLANDGVDLILGSHPHVVQPVEVLNSEINPEEKTVVFYSMGNIISNQREEEMGFQESENGVIPIIGLEEISDGDINMKYIKYIPTWVNKYEDSKTGKNVFEIIPIDDDISKISKKHNVDINDLKKCLSNVSSMMNVDGIDLYKKSV